MDEVVVTIIIKLAHHAAVGHLCSQVYGVQSALCISTALIPKSLYQMYSNVVVIQSAVTVADTAFVPQKLVLIAHCYKQ